MKRETKEKMFNVINWCLGVVLCSLGICLCTKGGFGLSMIAAPPYILHIWLRGRFSWFTQGTAEYFWQAVILLVTAFSARRFRLKYLLSFLTALCSGFVIDGWLYLLGGNGLWSSMPVRIASFLLGMCITSLAIAFYFHTTLPLSAYELIVTELSERYSWDKTKVKQINDAVMLLLSVLLAVLLNGSLTGIGIGTVIITLCNATLIRLCGREIERVRIRLGLIAE